MSIKPVLRWAGGKRWLLKGITDLLPKYFNQYHEPFLGSGSVFFHLAKKGMLKKGSVFLSDSNDDLINFFLVLKNNFNELKNTLEKYRNEKEYFYYLRSLQPKSIIERAAIFLFLNRTAFNGLYRVNFSGRFNVPYGNRKYQVLFDFELYKEISKLLDVANIIVTDFENTISNVMPGDFVFIDPPYTVAHSGNGFIRYNKKLFSLSDQKRLRIFLSQVHSKKAYYLMTNAYHEVIKEIFYNEYQFVRKVERFSGISGHGASRGYVKELIFTNYEVLNE